MFHYNMVQWLFFFYFYSFCGWCFESSYVSLKNHKWVNRGFMRGPFLPLYGSGAVMMFVVSRPFQDNVLLTYFAGCVGATALEYVTSVVMDALFNVKYWDYSYKRFQFQGRICLSSTITWGFFTIGMTRIVHRPIEQMMLAIPVRILGYVTFAVTIYIVADFTLSFKAAMDLREILLKMQRIKEEMAGMQKRLDAIKNAPSAYMDSVRDEIAELRARYNLYMENRENYKDTLDFYKRDMIRNNPGMNSQKFQDTFEELKDAVTHKRR